jgi:hypothetical protein
MGYTVGDGKYSIALFNSALMQQLTGINQAIRNAQLGAKNSPETINETMKKVTDAGKSLNFHDNLKFFLDH